MTSRAVSIVVTIVLLLGVNLAAPAASPDKRLRRADSFLGIHFDFHAGPDCTEIGKNTTRSMIENIIEQVHPDYIQIDCKGHRGLSSYLTNVGNRAPGFVGDPLRLWREVTAERGIALFMHYSGVWDSEAVERHPAWGAVDATGKVNGRATSFFGPYADELLIPQLRELAGDCGVDGVWVDGECWASVPDYSEPALKAFVQTTGVEEVPRKPGDPHWYEFLEFHREAFRRYLRRYITEVKQTHPDFQICSNWAFTDHMPEAVSAPVDFLSGDYSPEDSVNSARLSARYLVRQGKPWDLMAWSFSRTAGPGGTNQKTAVQLQREAAVVLAVGGGFQAYFKQKRDGSIYDERMPVMGEVARFCRDRQAVCHRAEPVPQIGLIFSTAAHYRRTNGLFSRELSQLSGNLQALLETQQSVEVLGEHQVTGRMSEYPLLVVPEWEYLEPEFKQELLAYVDGGGHLLLIGPKTAALFPAELGATLHGDASAAEPARVSHNGTEFVIQASTQNAELTPQATAFGELRPGAVGETPVQPAASICAVGRGKLAATYFTIGRGYLDGRSEAVRAFLADLVRELFPEPLVAVSGSSGVDLSVNRIQGRLAINLVNTSGPHASVPIIDTIPAVGPLEITIRSATAPTRIVSQPGNQELKFEHQDGLTRLTLPKLEIHTVVLVE